MPAVLPPTHAIATPVADAPPGDPQSVVRASPTHRAHQTWRRVTFTSSDGGARLLVPPGFAVTQEPFANYFLTGTWRVIPSAAGSEPGSVIVSLGRRSGGGKSYGSSTVTIQVGASRSPEALRSCTTFGGNSDRRPIVDRTLGPGWTVVLAGDAGMSQNYSSREFRRVFAGTCWAVSRIVSSESATQHPSSSLPSEAQVAREADAVLESLALLPARDR